MEYLLKSINWRKTVAKNYINKDKLKFVKPEENAKPKKKKQVSITKQLKQSLPELIASSFKNSENGVASLPITDHNTGKVNYFTFVEPGEITPTQKQLLNEGGFKSDKGVRRYLSKHKFSFDVFNVVLEAFFEMYEAPHKDAIHIFTTNDELVTIAGGWGVIFNPETRTLN